MCIHLEACTAVQEIPFSLDMLTQSSVCSVGFGRWQSSSGYCLSDEVIYGRGPILGQAECWAEGKASVAESISDVIYPAFRSSPTWVQSLGAVLLILQPTCSIYLLLLVEVVRRVILNWAITREDLRHVGCKHPTDYHEQPFQLLVLWRRVDLRPVTFFTAALPCPLVQHVGLGGRRRASPPRLRGFVEKRIRAERLHWEAINKY